MITGHNTYSDLVVSPCGFSQNLSVWPNPVAGVTTVRIASSKNSVITLNLTNAQGTQVFSRQFNLHTGNNEFRIDMSHFAAGIYSLNARTEEFSKTYKLLKAANQ
jgi:hypothetical protein